MSDRYDDEARALWQVTASVERWAAALRAAERRGAKLVQPCRCIVCKQPHALVCGTCERALPLEVDDGE